MPGRLGACPAAKLVIYRHEVIAPKVREHRGRIVKNTGDGAFVEFGSIVGAVRCALDVQRAMVARNAEQPETHRIHFVWAPTSVTSSSRRTTSTAMGSILRPGSKASPHRAGSASLLTPCVMLGGEGDAGLSLGLGVGSRPAYGQREA